MLGELLYEERPSVTEVIEYGTKFEDLMSGKAASCSAKIDFHFLNEIRGKLTGKVRGTAALSIVPSDVSKAEIRGTLLTDDGENILITALLYLSFLGPDTIYAKGSTYFYTESEKYRWANSTVGVTSGGGNPFKGDAAVKVYSWE